MPVLLNRAEPKSIEPGAKVSCKDPRQGPARLAAKALEDRAA